MDPYDTLLSDGEGPDVLSVMACTQRMLDTNEKVLASLDEQRKEKENIHQAIDDLKKKQEEVVTMLGQIKSSQSTSPSPKRLVSVNREVSLHVRGTYKDLMERDGFNGWQVTNRWNDPDNKCTTDKLVSEVKAQFPQFAEGDIRVSCRRYFQTLNQREKRRDKLGDDQIKQRRKQRKLRKLARRKKILNKAVNDKARLAKWQKVMNLDFMSSEESSDEQDSDDPSDSEECFIIRKIPWRSEKIDDFFKNKLDPIAGHSASKKSKKMRFKRIEGPSTSRLPPIRQYKDCLWVFQRNFHPVNTVQQAAP